MMESSEVDANTEQKSSGDELDNIVDKALLLAVNEHSDTKNGIDNEKSQTTTPSTNLYRF